MKEGRVSSPINAEKRFLQHHHQLELDMLAISFLKEEKVQPLYPPVLETCFLLWLYYIKNTLSYSWRCAGCSEDIRSLDVKVLVVTIHLRVPRVHILSLKRVTVLGWHCFQIKR